MLNKQDVQKIIDECRDMGAKGLGNGIKANIEALQVDFLTPPTDFLGLSGNPAVFVNVHTYDLLGKMHPTWQLNKTIAVKESFLNNKPIMILGILVHETGHAFNVAAEVANTEANAYIFEIEVLYTLFARGGALLFGCSNVDLQSYFKDRLPSYLMESKRNPYLATLVEKIKGNQSIASLNQYAGVLFNFKIKPVEERCIHDMAYGLG